MIKEEVMARKGEEVLFICIILVLICSATNFLIGAHWILLLPNLLLFFVFFYYTYRGYNWSRICLAILLVISGLVGSYDGVKVFLTTHYPVGVLVVIMRLLMLFFGFVLLLNNSVKVFASRARP